MQSAALVILSWFVSASMLMWAGTASGAELRTRVVDHEGRAVPDAVVAAKPLTPGAAPHAKPRDEMVEQIDKEFIPRVKSVPLGSLVHFPNRDNVQHQVYSFSPAKKFELPLYAGTAAPPVLFDKPGVVTLGCNIHDWMIGYIYVADTPYAATTGKEGTAFLRDLPPGEYEVRVWQPNMAEPEQSTLKRVTLAKSGFAEVEWRITLKPAFKIRRAPAAGRGAYR